jgi:pimeloyl-ACP methyl ester carboxylesterase
MSRASRLLPLLTATAVLACAAPAAAHGGLRFTKCGDAGAECATLRAPEDYDHPRSGTLDVHVARVPATDPAHRVGSLFLNFGGPGAPMAIYLEVYGPRLFPALNERFDLIGMDPRGTGETEGALDCHVNQETQGIYSQPFATPLNVDPRALIVKDQRYIQRCLSRNRTDVLAHASTANVARDMDLLRSALGERQLNYLGFSYGTFLGATYVSLFPRNYRAAVLDGALDADAYINRPSPNLFAQNAGFEREIGRFFQACARDQAACSGFGGADPWDAFDQLVDQANASPIPAAGYAPDPRPIDGDDLDAAAVQMVYSKFNWGDLAHALAAAEAGDGSEIRQIVDEFFYGRDADTGDYDPGLDRYFLLGAVEQRYTRDLGSYFEAGDRSWSQFDHAFWNAGYVELNYGLWAIHDRDAFYGPFRVPGSAATPLVVATTYDPATPYRGSVKLVRELGNARLLTMRGDGHTAYGNGSPDCIDPAIENYLFTLALPAPGTQCRQDVPFAAPQQQAAARTQAAPVRRPVFR